MIFKHTGGVADLAAEMMDNALIYTNKKRISRAVEPEWPFPPDKTKSTTHPFHGWLKPFRSDEKVNCAKMNTLIENWPDRFNETSVYILDMFKDSEDDMQDFLTRTMAVAFEGTNELGDTSADNKRLTYAWRIRHKLLYNADRFKLQADILTFWFLVFNLLATFSAVCYVYIQLHLTEHTSKAGYLLKANLLLPLMATLLRGVFSVLSPSNKYEILKDAAEQIESEIYMYRAKVGIYNPRKALVGSDATDLGPDADDNEPPRKLFSNALEKILASVSEGSAVYR